MSPDIVQSSNHFADQERKLLDLLPKQEENDVSQLAESLEVSAEELLRIAKTLSQRGYRIKYDGARNILRLLKEGEDGEIKYPDIGDVVDHFKIAFISETRIGAKQQQICLLKGVYEGLFRRLGVSFVVLAGNLTVGKPDSGSLLTSIHRDTFLLSAQEQRDFVVKHFPTVGKKIKTYVIAGRRDLTFRGKQAYSIVQDICQRRSDLAFWGDKMRTFEVRGLKIAVMNPYDDNGPQGKTYGVQQIADSLDDPHPDVLLVGGMHRYAEMPDYWNDGFGYVFLLPSFHTQMARQSNKRAPVRPDIGVFILDINFNEQDEKGHPKITGTGYNLNPYADASGMEHFEPYPEHDENSLSKEECKIIRWVHEASGFGVSGGEISRRLKSNREKAEGFIKHLQKLGYPIAFSPDIKKWIIQQKIRKDFPPRDIEIEREVEFGTLGDTHLTSTHQQIQLLKRAYETFSQRGIHNVFHAGDLSEGSPSSGYRGHGRHVVGSNPDQLLDYVVARYPRLKLGGDKRGRTFAISGNHDGWFLSQGGLDFVKAFARLRSDVEYLGEEYGSTIIENVYYYLLHPRGGAGDTLSRKLERFIARARNLMSKGKGYPRVMLLGNWHRALAFFDRDILGFLVPCMKSEDEFHATLGLVPKLGFWIVKLGLDKDNNIVSFTPEYFGFSEEDIDPWDYKDVHQWELRRANLEKRKARKQASK